MITVCLYGGLREYGRRFVLHVETPAEALHALFTQIKGLRRRIRDGVYQVRFDGKDQSEETIGSVFRRPADGVLHIVPHVQGAGKNGGLIQTVIGAVLIVVGAFTSWAGGTQLIAVGMDKQKVQRLNSMKKPEISVFIRFVKSLMKSLIAV